ncbi:hypothetical protein CRUP_022316 [Coryphaenoides rupestris]|nr:hypothetical protein CRUP_022316 [Coryphaenoides rupestris]
MRSRATFTSSLGVGYLMVCTESYPSVLAFCFLDELQKEFLVTYDAKRINSAMLEPVTLPGVLSCMLSLLCGGLNLLRGVHAIESMLQCYLFAYFSIWRSSKSFLALGLICLCSVYLYELRNGWQVLFHVTVGASMTLQIWLQQPLGKAPDYNV